MEHDLWFLAKIYNFDPYNVLLAIATNIPVLLPAGFVVQGHKYAAYWGLTNIFKSCTKLLSFPYIVLS